MPHPVISGYLPVENGRIFYEVAGGGAPIVFLHGFTLDHRMWDAQWDFFRSQRMVIRYDTRGHGRSTDPEGPWSSADDLLMLLANLGVERAHICGLSAGGRLAQEFALTYPHAARSLTLIDSTIGGFRGWSPELRGFLDGLRPIAREQGLEAAKEAWLGSGIFAPALEQPQLAAQVRRIVDGYRGWNWLNDGREAGLDPQPYDRLEDILCPTLVLVGERDLEDFQNMADALAERVRGARKQVVAGAGHMANMERAGAVNRLIDAFLAEVEATQPRF
jgi:pimeloyl-ACP methyl ester carboxylesterase